MDMGRLHRLVAAVFVSVVVAGGAAAAGPGGHQVGVRARTGFDLNQSWTTLEPDADGMRRVRLPDALGRVELLFTEAVTSAHMVANGELRPMPIGASVREDRFAWAPPVGYVGAYVLRFGLGGGTVDVEVSLVPVRRPAEGESEIRMHLDVVDSTPCRTGTGACARVVGWALDPQAAIGAGIEAVHVWAVGPGPIGTPVFLGVATLGAERPDVAASFGAAFGRAGFSLRSSVPLAAGPHSVTAYVWNQRTARWEDARTGTVIVK